MPDNTSWMSLTKGGKRTSEYSAPPKKKKKKKNPTQDLSAGGAFKNVLKISSRER